MNNLMELLTSKNLSISEIILKNIDKSLSLKDFLVFFYLLNHQNEGFDCLTIANTLNISEQDVMNSFNNLIMKKIIDYKTMKENNKIKEVISFSNFYQEIIDKITSKNQEKESNDIYDIFQKQLVRSLSPIEYEYINNWLDKGISQELIIAALDNAILSGAKNFRYIDTVLFNWQKQGFKTLNDVNTNRKKKVEEKQEENTEFFDYDWLNDGEE